MDSITHIVLGACIGEIFVGKKIGKSALLLGAVAQSVPDIDFVASFFLSPADDLLAHRGFTHSILFALLVIPLLAWFSDWWRRPHDVSFKTWLLFFATEIAAHLILDTSNAYGTGLLEPFSHLRFSYNTMFVADPLFSIIPGVVAIMLLVNKTHKKRTIWAVTALVWCSIYFTIAIFNKQVVETAIKESAKQNNLVYSRHFTTPTPFNNLLWYAVLESDSGYYTGYRSVFDKGLANFDYRPKNDYLINNEKQRHDIQQLITFSNNYYTTEKFGDTLVFNDLRFGQITGWEKKNARFAFYYYINDTANNDLLIQRGRFKNWNASTIGNLIQRMKGN